MSSDKNDKSKLDTPEAQAEETAAIEAMKQRADGGHVATPKELEVELDATKKMMKAFEPRPIETPVYKPPPSM